MRRYLALSAACSLALTGVAAAQTADAPLDGQAMYGIHRDDGSLVRYDFDADELTTVGPVHTADGTLRGIEASAYVPGFQNLFAFWQGDDHNAKLVYVDVQNGEAVVVADDMEGGQVTGATALPDANGDWGVYAVQRADVPAPFTVSGLININPNNSSDNEFRLDRPDGESSILRDDLHAESPMHEGGTYYEGKATYVRVRPKGSGKQNDLHINGEPIDLKNSNTYLLVGDMDVRVYNDHYKNGKAMGKWWLEITSGTANWAEDVALATPDRLIHVNHRDGEVTELFPLERGYDSLAAVDTQTFYATRGRELWKLDASEETETLVGTMSADNNFAAEQVNGAAMTFESTNDRLHQVDLSTGDRIGTAQSLGAHDLGTIVFVGLGEDVFHRARSYD